MRPSTIRAYDWIANHALRRADAPAAVDLATGRRFTYGEFHARIDGLAAGLAGTFGIAPGDRVAVLAQSSTDVFELQFACFRLGAIFVPLNLRLTPVELAAILANCAPALLVHDKAFEARAVEISGPNSRWRLVGCGPGSTCEAAAASGQRLKVPAEMNLHDTATLLYTSGTTGQPKGVIVTYAMNLFNALNSAGVTPISERSVMLCVMPLFHTAGLNCFANPIFHSGGAVAVAGSFDPGETLRQLGDAGLGITHMFGVPAHYQFLAAHPDFAATDLGRLESVTVGGAPAPLPVIEAWQRRGVALAQGYGMTETGPMTLCLDRADAVRKVGSAGKLAMHMELRLVDGEGRDVDDEEVGEIWLRGPSITPGYWENPAATEQALAGGWLHTGDAARRDAEGYYFIVDRWKDMYISGGENVYPAEVENVLYRIEGVAEAAVIGVPSARWGETGRAVVVLKSGVALDPAMILAQCAGQLARYKLPQDVVFTEALPRNATGKVHKPTLRAAFGGAAAV